MPKPKTQTEVSVSWDASTSSAALITSTCEPLFKLFQKNAPMEWNEDCQFDKKDQDIPLSPACLYLFRQNPLLIIFQSWKPQWGVYWGSTTKLVGGNRICQWRLSEIVLSSLIQLIFFAMMKFICASLTVCMRFHLFYVILSLR